jgi:hypothetical protein
MPRSGDYSGKQVFEDPFVYLRKVFQVFDAYGFIDLVDGAVNRSQLYNLRSGRRYEPSV